MGSWSSTLALVLFAVSLGSFPTAAVEVDPIIIKWSQFFFKSNGSEFFIRGINYQYFGVNGASSTEYIDPLSDKTICERDIPYLQRLSVNVVRVTYLDPTRDHTLCLNLLAAAGIYVITDLSGPTDRLSLEPRWDTNMVARYTSVVDALAGFTNILAFSVGDLYFDSSYKDSMPFIKAAVRDIKKHIQDKKYRSIPVGYNTDTTVGSLSIDEMEYMTCDAPRVDFMGLRMTYSYYTNCTSDDDINHTANVFRNSTIPVFLDSWGCRVDPSNDNRTFEQIDTLYSNNVSRVLAGGIVEGYFQRTDPESNFGLVNAHYDTVDVTDGFRIFSSRIASASPISTNLNDYVPVATASQNCSSKTSHYGVESTVLPPIPNKKLCSCMMGRSAMRCVAKEDGFNKMNATDQYYALKEICENKQDSCIGIYSIGSLGEYGAFSSCNRTETYSWATNGYWQRHGDSACDLNETAHLIDAPPAISDPECDFLLQQAKEDGAGTITAAFKASPTSPGSPGPLGSTVRGGLSIGAKAGIGVACAIIALLLVLGILWAVRRKRAGRAGPRPAVYEHYEVTTADSTETKTSLYPHYSDRPQPAVQTDDYHALHQSPEPAELGSLHEPMELDDGIERASRGN